MKNTMRPLWLLLAAVAVAAGTAAAVGAGGGAEADSSIVELDAILPPHETTQEDEYLCTAVELPDRPMKVISVESLSEQATVHHMLMFGCKEPAERKPVWPCRMTPACGPGGEHVMYGWGKNAPAVRLPPDAGFSVGPGTSTRTVVLQVHYLNLRPANDTSGVRVRLTSRPVPRSAGLVAFAAGFTVPPRKASTLVPNQCCYSGFEPLHGFAFRVHTHALGRGVYMDHASAGAGGKDAGQRAQRVLQQNPQLPQGFYPADPMVSILPGDRLKTTCDFNSSHMDHAVHAGHTSKDEMCNLYLMVYSELPFFMWCVDGGEWVQTDGAGGVPTDAQLLPEVALWAPPASIPASPAPAPNEAAEGPPTQQPVGQIAGVAAGGQDDTVWAFFRGERTWTEHTFDAATHRVTKAEPIRSPAVAQLSRDNGTVLHAWGAGVFYMPHMVSVDHDGNVWVVDTALHQALKFSPEGEQLLALGRRLDPGADAGAFCMPTHAVTARNGSVYVGDGYCNARVVQFSAAGAYEREFRLPPAGDGGAPAPLPHSLALDECRRRLYVADREVGRVLAFDMDSGDVVGSWDLKGDHGLPYALRTGPYGGLLVLAWDRDRSGAAKLVALGSEFGEVAASWVLEGAQAPHDLALAPAPLAVTGAGERLLAVVVAETAAAGSRMRKYVLRGAHHTHAGDEAEGAGAGAGEEQPAGLAASHAGHGTKLKPAGGGKAGGGGGASEAEGGLLQKESPPGALPAAALGDGAEGGAAAQLDELLLDERREPPPPPGVWLDAAAERAAGAAEHAEHAQPAARAVRGGTPPLDGKALGSASLLAVLTAAVALALVGVAVGRWAVTWRRTTARGYRPQDRSV